MGNRVNHNQKFGWSEILAALMAVGLVTLASPFPAASAEPAKRFGAEGFVDEDSDDWNFLWIAPSQHSTHNGDFPSQLSGLPILALSAITTETTAPYTLAEIDVPQSKDTSLSRRIDYLPVSVRFTPPVMSTDGLTPTIAMREDLWTMVDIDGVMRLTAYARGPLDATDTDLAKTSTPLTRGQGTGFSLITGTPVYLGATVKTDRAVYDIDADRFRGARWTTSIFMGTETAFGPLYLGTTQEPSRARSTYLYLGRSF